MILSNIQVKAFKSIYEIGTQLDPRINVLIGANESGKTNILRAIESFRPDTAFDSTLTCQYSNHYYEGKCPEIEFEFSGLTADNKKKLLVISKVFKDVEHFSILKDGPNLANYHVKIGDQIVENINIRRLLDTLPQIIYFSEIPLIKNRVDLKGLTENKNSFLTEKNLVKIAGIDNIELLFEDSTRGRRAGEEAGRAVSEQIRRVWSQEPSIEIKLSVNRDVMYIDVSDDSTVFDTPETRSLGFRWYLSFYINFMAQTFEGRANEFIFLIDEPGIHLHPAGQKDLVKVVEDLSVKNQVMFTTHSPFMIDRQHPERVMLVSKDKDGTHIDRHSYRENWRPLRRSIGLMIGDLFFFNDSGFILELPTRKKTDPGILKRLKIFGTEEESI